MIRLTDEQGERIRAHFPEEQIPDGRAGRKPVPARQVLEAALWILNTGAQWQMLPQCYPNYKTVHRRFQSWCHNEVLRGILTDVANELRERGVLDEEECFIDATFAMAKGGGAEIGPTRRGKGLKIMAIVDRHGLPHACCEPPRSTVGAAMLRLLHDRGQARKPHRRSRLR
jgi:transposase